MFEAAEEPLDKIPMLVSLGVVAFLPGPVFVRLDAGPGFQLFDQLACFITVVSRIAEHVCDLAPREFGEQLATVRAIAVLAGAEFQADQMPLGIDGRRELRIQPSARPAETAAMVGGLFFSSA